MTQKPTGPNGGKKSKGVGSGAGGSGPSSFTGGGGGATISGPAPGATATRLQAIPGHLPKAFAAPRLGLPVDMFLGSNRQAKDVLLVQGPRLDADGFVRAAIDDIETYVGGTGKVEQVRKLLDAGGTEQVAKATEKLAAGGLDRTERLLLSIPGVYAAIIKDAVVLANKTPPEFNLNDTVALVSFVKRQLAAPGGVKEKFATGLLTRALAKRGVQIPAVFEDRIVAELKALDIPLSASRAEEAIFAVVESWREKGTIAAAVDAYIVRKEIDPARFTDRVRRKMIDFLEGLGLSFEKNGQFDTQGLAAGEYDEYFALAYQHVISGSDGGSADPIDAVRHRGAVSDWDFTVDAFDTVEAQGVIPQNILAAGALDYVNNLGERLGMFRLADAVVLRWGSGTIDLDPGETPAKLYRYWKLRAERTSPEERGMLYKRVLNQGDGELLEGMVANEAFPELWGALMTAVTDYIARVEEKKTEENSVSRQRIYQATKQLQYNLTEFTTGMAQMQITEMYHHLQEARGILEDTQVVDYFGSGRRKTIWTVIERGSKEWFDYSPNIAAIRDAAVQGNKVFQWIAYFDQATVTDAAFQEFRDAAEAWILAQGAGDAGIPADSPEPEQSDADTPKNDAKDDFDRDWDA